MALPKINDKPKYSLTIPSTGEVVRFRPYLVKEEKVLMLAMESEDAKQIVNAIVDTIDACVEGDLPRNKLKMYDVEYMFTQIRGKSVGETTEINMICTECDARSPVTIKFDDIKVDIPDVSDIIQATDDIKIKMQWPSYTKLMNQMSGGELTTADALKTLNTCIHSILTEEEVFHAVDQTEEELTEFVDSLPPGVLKDMQTFIEAMPRLEKPGEYDCISCGHHNTYKLQGIQDFF